MPAPSAEPAETKQVVQTRDLTAPFAGAMVCTGATMTFMEVNRDEM